MPLFNPAQLTALAPSEEVKWQLPGALFLAFTLISCDTGRSPAPTAAGQTSLASPVTAPAVTESGRNIYNFRCYFCHGYSGNARTLAASFISPPPTNFTVADAARMTPEHIVSVLQKGKPGTAMKSFLGILSNSEMQQVAGFVTDEFIRKKAPNTRYHTPENGWPEHERYRPAFPFATGEIPLDRPWENLNKEQAQGKRLFMSSCISCHSHGPSGDAGIVWEARPLSYPRNNYSHNAPPSPDARSLDAMTSASPYLLHDIAPTVAGLSPLENRGKQLFENNCAFCHGADGTGKNWIGSFLEPHPRNLRDPAFMSHMTRARLTSVIREGLPGTSMPSWKSVLGKDDIAAIVAFIAKAFHPLPS